MNIIEFTENIGIKISNIQKDMLSLIEADPSWQQRFKPAFQETKAVLQIYQQWKDYHITERCAYHGG